MSYLSCTSLNNSWDFRPATYLWWRRTSCASQGTCSGAATRWASSRRSSLRRRCWRQVATLPRVVYAAGNDAGNLWRVPCGLHTAPSGSCGGVGGWSWSRSPGSWCRWCTDCKHTHRGKGCFQGVSGVTFIILYIIMLLLLLCSSNRIKMFIHSCSYILLNFIFFCNCTHKSGDIFSKSQASTRGKIITDPSSYIAQYPVHLIAQSALHFTTWQTFSLRHQLDSLGSIQPHCNYCVTLRMNRWIQFFTKLPGYMDRFKKQWLTTSGTWHWGSRWTPLQGTTRDAGCPVWWRSGAPRSLCSRTGLRCGRGIGAALCLTCGRHWT